MPEFLRTRTLCDPVVFIVYYYSNVRFVFAAGGRLPLRLLVLFSVSGVFTLKLSSETRCPTTALNGPELFMLTFSACRIMESGTS